MSIPKAEQDPKLGEKLRAEAPGISAWAVQGCLKWQREGLGEPSAVSSARDQYREEMDVVADFIADCCIEIREGREAFGDLYAAYQRWCQRHLAAAMTSTAFGTRLTEKGFQPERTSGARHRQGLTLREEVRSVNDGSRAA